MISRERARRLRALIEKAIVGLSDADALECVTLFPAWEQDMALTAEQRVGYNGKLYKVVQAHTSQSDWTPDITPALYTEVALPGEIPVWKQPTGAQDAYMIGDKVWYPDKDTDVWTSTVDNNVWAPGVYGWEVTDE